MAKSTAPVQLVKKRDSQSLQDHYEILNDVTNMVYKDSVGGMIITTMNKDGSLNFFSSNLTTLEIAGLLQKALEMQAQLDLV